MRISERLRELLLEVIDTRTPELRPCLGPNGSIALNADQWQRLQDAIADELCTTGLRDDSEPNARGLMLEDLIDITVGALREGE